MYVCVCLCVCVCARARSRARFAVDSPPPPSQRHRRNPPSAESMSELEPARCSDAARPRSESFAGPPPARRLRVDGACGLPAPVRRSVCIHASKCMSLPVCRMTQAASVSTDSTNLPRPCSFAFPLRELSLLSPSLPLSPSPSLPLSLSPSLPLPLSLSPSLPLSLSPSLPPPQSSLPLSLPPSSSSLPPSLPESAR